SAWRWPWSAASARRNPPGGRCARSRGACRTSNATGCPTMGWRSTSRRAAGRKEMGLDLRAVDRGAHPRCDRELPLPRGHGRSIPRSRMEGFLRRRLLARGRLAGRSGQQLRAGGRDGAGERVMIARDASGIAHVVALSGGKDSTALALRMREVWPELPVVYVCTPTGNELPDMIEHWLRLG